MWAQYEKYEFSSSIFIITILPRNDYNKCKTNKDIKYNIDIVSFAIKTTFFPRDDRNSKISNYSLFGRGGYV